MLGSLQGLQQPVQQQQQGQGPQGQLGQQQQQPIPPPPPSNGQDFTLSSVLHYLQTEWRRYERDRNEWEIERAEMRVRRGRRPWFVIDSACCRHGSLCSRANDDPSTTSSSTSCAALRCSSMLCVSRGQRVLPSPSPPSSDVCIEQNSLPHPPPTSLQNWPRST